MIELGCGRMGDALFVKLLGEPLRDKPDFADGLAAFGGLDDERLDVRTFGRIEFAKHEGRQPGVVGIDVHDRLSSRSARDSAASPANN